MVLLGGLGFWGGLVFVWEVFGFEEFGVLGLVLEGFDVALCERNVFIGEDGHTPGAEISEFLTHGSWVERGFHDRIYGQHARFLGLPYTRSCLWRTWIKDSCNPFAESWAQDM